MGVSILKILSYKFFIFPVEANDGMCSHFTDVHLDLMCQNAPSTPVKGWDHLFPHYKVRLAFKFIT